MRRFMNVNKEDKYDEIYIKCKKKIVSGEI